MERTWMPTTAGILSIIAGALSLLGALVVAIIATVLLASSSYSGPGDWLIPAASFWIVFLPYIIISAVAIAGGYYALRRRLWGLALAGAVCALFTVWAWPLGVAAIVFLAISKHEFDHPLGPPANSPQLPLLP